MLLTIMRWPEVELNHRHTDFQSITSLYPQLIWLVARRIWWCATDSVTGKQLIKYPIAHLTCCFLELVWLTFFEEVVFVLFSLFSLSFIYIQLCP